MNDKIKVTNSNNEEIPISYSTFPAGEEYVCISDLTKIVGKTFTITVNSADSSTLIRACLIADAIRGERDQNVRIVGVFDYLPYGRQDRVCKRGESYSLYVISKLLKANFDYIKTHDVHSSQTIQCLGSSYVSKYLTLYNQVPYINVKTRVTSELNTIFNSDYVVVSVDKGAIERSQHFARYINSNKVFYLSKTRKDGTIVVEQADNSNIDMIKNNQHFVLSDDIIDGGNSYFVTRDYILKVNPNAKISLVFSHGIFSGGLEKLYSCFENIYVVNDDYNNYRLSLLETK